MSNSELLSPLISEIVSVSTARPYRLGVASLGNLLYVDRGYRFTSLPSELQGQQLIMSSNEDDFVDSTNHLAFNLQESAQLFVAVEGNYTQRPGWIDDSWQIQPASIDAGLAGEFHLFSKSFAAGPVVLGGNDRSNTSARSNYFVIAAPISSPITSGSGDDSSTPPTEDTVASTSLISEITSVSSGRNYSLGTANTGNRLYTDRSYVFDSLPVGLQGTELIMSSNEDDFVGDDVNHLSFSLSSASKVYVALEDNYSQRPDWLEESWQPETGSITAGAAGRFELFSKTFAPGSVVLGGNGRGETRARSNYFVLVAADESADELDASEVGNTGQNSDGSSSPDVEVAALITEITEVSSNRPYLLETAELGQRLYTDRDYAITSMPPELQGQALIMPSNEDDFINDSDHLSFNLRSTANVFVALEGNYVQRPNWLDDSWHSTNSSISAEGAGEFSLFSKIFSPGQVVLGGNDRNNTEARSNYFVIAASESVQLDTTEIDLPMKLNIMPMGDSITEGFNVSGGYRKPLYNLLTAEDYNFDFVGSKLQLNPSDSSPDPNHWGQAGWQIADTNEELDGKSYVSLQGNESRTEGSKRQGLFDEIASAISPNYFSTSSSERNIVLLMIGTNDLIHQVVGTDYGAVPAGDLGDNAEGEQQNYLAESNFSRLRSLVGEIDIHASRHELNLEVVISTIPDISLNYPGGDPISSTTRSELLEYNDLIRYELGSSNYQNISVSTVDQYQATLGYLSDGIHPSGTGFEHMAQEWLRGIQVT